MNKGPQVNSISKPPGIYMQLNEETESTEEASKDPFEKEKDDMEEILKSAPNDFYKEQRQAAASGKTTKYAWLALGIVLFARIAH